jgi:hypothetical protein
LIFKDEVVFNNGSVYKGQCKVENDRSGDIFIKHGYGVLSYPDGAKYQGQFKEDVKEGRGLLVRGDGNVYEGKIFFIETGHLLDSILVLYNLSGTQI